MVTLLFHDVFTQVEQRERERERERKRENFKSHIVNGVLKLLDIFMGSFVSTETCFIVRS